MNESNSKYLKTVVGIFHPKRIDDLMPESKNVIGKKFTWMYSWIIEDGEYKNQWAMTIRDRDNPNYKLVPFAWIPECDVDVESEEKNIKYYIDKVYYESYEEMIQKYPNTDLIEVTTFEDNYKYNRKHYMQGLSWNI